MNEHIATYPSSRGLTALWLTTQTSPADETALEMFNVPTPAHRKLPIEFRRIVLGMNFDPLFLCVVGERWFEYDDRTESVYVVLDECLETDVPAEVFRYAIELKDRYRASHLFAPEAPSGLAESLRRTEGLAFYAEPKVEAVSRQRWPTFVDYDTTANVVLKPAPDPQHLTSELNEIMSSNAIDPKTNQHILGADGVPIPRLLFLDDFPMYRTLQSVRTGSPGGATALWMALKGLSSTTVMQRLPDDDLFAPRETSRNPTGY